MKSLIFDTGPIISLAMNNLLCILAPLKKRFKGRFYFPTAVRMELIDKPIQTKRFKFEALQMLKQTESKVIEEFTSSRIDDRAKMILELANSIFKCKGNNIKILHRGESSAIATVLELDSEALVVDERTTRVLIESPQDLQRLLQRKLHDDVAVDRERLDKLTKMTKDISIIRSSELVAMAFELGLLDSYISEKLDNAEETLLESVLWGVKLNGCSISDQEINEIINLEKAWGNIK